jgi:hypothetical protein
MKALNETRRRVFALVTFGFLLLCRCSSDKYGARVVVQNADTVPLHSVVVRVTGNSYLIGELPASETRTINTYPTGESHIVIEHVNAKGEMKELPVDCYFEPGYRSTIKVKVAVDSATKTELLRD